MMDITLIQQNKMVYLTAPTIIRRDYGQIPFVVRCNIAKIKRSSKSMNIVDKLEIEYKGNENIIKEFYNLVDRRNDNECWLWLGSKSNVSIYTPKYYGFTKYEGKTISAHRLSYILHNGEIPKDKEVCHTCDNGVCVNPKHLFLGTHQDNMTDMVNKRRSYKHIGEENPNSKLTQCNVNKIREEYNNGENQVIIGRKWGVSHCTIGLIIANKIWKDCNYSPVIRTGKEGENNPFAKLTWNDVREIRKIYKEKRIRQIDLAKQYKVSVDTISDILNKKTWKENYTLVK